MSHAARTLGGMRITKLEHSCLIVEDGGDTLVIDPGSFTRPVDADGVVAVVITHEHPDHWTPDQLRGILDRNPEAVVFGPAGVVASASDFGRDRGERGHEGCRRLRAAVLRRPARGDPPVDPDRRQRRRARERHAVSPGRLLRGARWRRGRRARRTGGRSVAEDRRGDGLRRRRGAEAGVRHP